MNRKQSGLAALATATILNMPTCLEPAQAQEAKKSTLTSQEVDSIFGNYQGTFVIEKLNGEDQFVYNDKLSKQRFSPCSTFKIFNSLAGLESKVISSERESKSWDGTKYSIKGWNQDQTLQSAVTYSVLWYFQDVARSIGPTKMQEYLNKCDYGNRKMSPKVDKFWIDGSLKISPREQVDFIRALVKDQLPFSKRNMALVRGLIRAKQKKSATVYGKTGTDMKDGKVILGWYVGYLVRPDDTYVFATLIQADDQAWGPTARRISESLLTKMNLL